MKAAVIELRQVRRRYQGAGGLQDVSLILPPGRITAVLGASGSGKSTLLRLIAGLEPVERGQIRFGDTVVSDSDGIVAPERRRVGLVFQDYALFPHLTALDNVAFGLSGDRAARLGLAQSWLDRVGLGHRAAAYPHALSGGEQQRVALARALAPEPVAVLLDEPFSGLDPVLRAELREVTLAALRRASATAVFVTHDADEALYLADQLVVLKEGRLLQAGEPREVYRAPTSPDAAAALGPVNLFRGRVHDGSLGTPFLSLPALLAAEGSEAVAAVRVEAIRLAPGDTAEVLDVRPQGAADLVRVKAGDLIWRALAPAAHAPLPGARVDLSVEAGGAFVFPA